MLEFLKTSEEVFSHNDYFGQENDAEFFSFEDRKSRVVLSAPHAIRTFVCKKVKAPDLFTGALVKVIGEKFGYSSLVRTGFCSQKILINDFIKEKNLGDKYFLDIHGMDNSREFDLAVGTGNFSAGVYRSEILKIRELTEKYKIKMVINHPDYRGIKGLTGRYQKEFGLPQVLQLEWRQDFRNFYTCPEKVLEQTIPFIAELADFLS